MNTKERLEIYQEALEIILVYPWRDEAICPCISSIERARGIYPNIFKGNTYRWDIIKERYPEFAALKPKRVPISQRWWNSHEDRVNAVKTMITKMRSQ